MEAKLLGKMRPKRISRADSGGLLTAFLLEMAADNHKAQRKQGEDKRVFLWLRDDAAVKAQSHSSRGKVRVEPRKVPHIPANKIANRLVY